MIIRVRFHADERGFCTTVFKSVDTARFYNRAEFDGWYKATSENWENDYRIQDDVVFEVVDSSGNVLFTESNGNLGAFMSIDKKAQKVSAGYKKKLSLKPYEKWKRWLLADKSVHGYTGYDDNWLHYESKEISSETLEEYSHLGRKFRVVIYEMEHPICGKKWRSVYVIDAKNNNGEALCGFIF